jgi:dTDP-4-amino-4,6-dideoxygalactose transaminase
VGVKPGTEVIVPGYTSFATAAPILQCGGRPVFCDIDPRTLLADADDAERRVTARTRAICVVHLWGNAAPLDCFVEIARRHGLALIEDCSHAHGARYAATITRRVRPGLPDARAVRHPFGTSRRRASPPRRRCPRQCAKRPWRL